MDYSKLISVTGLPGLYELMASKKEGAVVRSLDDKSSRFVSSRLHNFSHLESIEVYTQYENVNLADVFFAMQKSSETLPSEKDAAAIKSYFQKVFPTMDFDRVYASDMKKMIRWFSVLTANNIEIKLPEAVAEEETETEEKGADTSEAEKAMEEVTAVVEVPAKEEKPKKKAAKKKKEE